MSLLLRLVRALSLCGLILGSYLLQLGLVRLFGRRGQKRSTPADPAPRLPPWLARRRTRIDARNARRLHRGILRLRGVYIKLGQILSVMGGFLPRVYSRELEALQDRVPPRPFSEVRAVVGASVGSSPQACFRAIEHEPIAAASLGQVHTAWLHDGTKVAVKVLYPGIRDVIRVDLRVVRLALRVYNRFVPVENLDRVHDALVDLLRRETDYLQEAAAMERLAGLFADEDDIRFPGVVHELTTRDVLTMTYMEGIKVTDLASLEAHGVDRTHVATRLVQIFYRQLFVHRYFHADPHPGNFLVQPGDPPCLVLLDFGAVCEVRVEMVEGMVDVLRGFFEASDALVLRGVERIGFMAPGGDRELLERTVKVYFEKLLKVRNPTAGALMRAGRDDLERLVDPELERRELRQLMRSIRHSDGWFYIERAAVLLFWLAGQLDPELDTLRAGFPYVLPLLASRTS